MYPLPESSKLELQRKSWELKLKELGLKNYYWINEEEGRNFSIDLSENTSFTKKLRNSYKIKWYRVIYFTSLLITAIIFTILDYFFLAVFFWIYTILVFSEFFQVIFHYFQLKKKIRLKNEKEKYTLEKIEEWFLALTNVETK